MLTIEGQPSINLRALHTPGHARGHLCFYDERTGALISGDNIVGFGSVLIDPPEGNMREYLDSLRRMRALPNLSVLFGGHGPAIANPYEKLDEYISRYPKPYIPLMSGYTMGGGCGISVHASCRRGNRIRR